MSDDFEAINHMGLEEDHQEDFTNQFEHPQYDDNLDGYWGATDSEMSEAHTHFFGDLEPTGDELYHLNLFEEPSYNASEHEAHGHMLGEEISCSDCSGSCAAYCASMNE
ncbi:MAG TPA: hypothetical protein VHO66_08220 [Ruminiclostridium sp.]|nr:hypothetical protein [Ruminiclostridium sp.]